MSEPTPAPSKEEQVREALRAVVDPEIGLNVIELA
jgi:metal-sulfur cluster biosynthetic enzyme